MKVRHIPLLTSLVAAFLLAMFWGGLFEDSPRAAASSAPQPATDKAAGAVLPGEVRPFDITQRALWTRSRVIGTPEPPPAFRSAPVFTKLKFDHPLHIVNEPGSNRMIVVQQNGKLLRFANDPEVERAEDFLDVGQEAYGFNFHPRFAENGYMYVVSNGPRDAKVKRDRVSRFTIGREAPFACDPKSELVIIEWESNGHNGGDVAFGPDGFLYIPAGDGTSDSDTDLTGQNLRTLTATLMRIDVDHPDKDRNYSVPADNPFVGRENVLPEIWAFGFRNPWRITFDSRTGDCWVGNIGQDQWEMIHVVRRGENYGWSVHEGGNPFYLERELAPVPYVKPTIEHPHSEARSITGGLVYYGKKYPELHGLYLYGDYSTGKIWGARYRNGKIVHHEELADTSVQILGFGTDPEGEIYLADYAGGIARLERTPKETPPHDFPRKLSETGLFDSVEGHVTDSALVPYSVNASLWSDGAFKERYLALPAESTIKFGAKRGWDFPEGTVLVKTFSLEMEAGRPETRKRIETRLLHKYRDEWNGYSYLWNDEQQDAVLVDRLGTDRQFTIRDPQAEGGRRIQAWHYPSRAECMVCHTRAAKYVLGISTSQMNRDHDYGNVTANQLAAYEFMGLFGAGKAIKTADLWMSRRNGVNRMVLGLLRDIVPLAPLDENRDLLGQLSERPALIDASPLSVPQDLLSLAAGLAASQKKRKTDALAWDAPVVRPALPKRPPEFERLVDPYDESAPLDLRARSYLHANCSICHVAAGGGNAAMELEFTTERDKMLLFDVPPLHDKFGKDDARLIAPGSPERSVLLHRLSHRGRGQMPPLASAQVDERAVKLFREWILSLD